MHHSTVPMVPSTLDATVTFPSDIIRGVISFASKGGCGNRVCPESQSQDDDHSQFANTSSCSRIQWSKPYIDSPPIPNKGKGLDINKPCAISFFTSGTLD